MSGVPHPGPPPGDHPRPVENARPADQPRQEQGRPEHGRGGDARDLWPRDFGRDGVSGLVTLDRAMRSRDVSRPDSVDDAAAEAVLADLLARVDGRQRTDARSRAARPLSPQPEPPVPHPPAQRNDS